MGEHPGGMGGGNGRLEGRLPLRAERIELMTVT